MILENFYTIKSKQISEDYINHVYEIVINNNQKNMIIVATPLIEKRLKTPKIFVLPLHHVAILKRNN